MNSRAIYSVRNNLGEEMFWSTAKKAAVARAQEMTAGWERRGRPAGQFGPYVVYRAFEVKTYTRAPKINKPSESESLSYGVRCNECGEWETDCKCGEVDEKAEKLRIRQLRHDERRAQLRALKRANCPIPAEGL